jgi:molybdenum cofactor cytidylyltransferase
VAAPALSVLIPAAGASTRLGQAKQLVDYRGNPLLGHVIDLVSSINPFEIIVVTGAYSDAIREKVRNPGVRWLHNPRWPDGLGGSIALGAAAASPASAGLMILLCDQYRVQENNLLALKDTWLHAPGRIVAAEAGGRCMPPLIFPPDLFIGLSKLAGETGARELLTQHPERVTAVPMSNAAFDLDNPEQLQKLQADQAP